MGIMKVHIGAGQSMYSWEEETVPIDLSADFGAWSHDRELRCDRMIAEAAA